MQGGNNWFWTLDMTYNKLGYTTSCADPCVQYKKEGKNYKLTDAYTDNVFGASKSSEEMKERKEEIGKVWEVKDVGSTEFFLGMKVQQDLKLGTVWFTQCPY